MILFNQTVGSAYNNCISTKVTKIRKPTKKSCCFWH